MGTLLQDLRFAVRQLRKHPGFTFTAVVIFALGIGASTAIFAFVDAALVKPLPYRSMSAFRSATGTTSLTSTIWNGSG
jgi:macrolide transport system ATP-binding/permease protein